MKTVFVGWLDVEETLTLFGEGGKNEKNFAYLFNCAMHIFHFGPAGLCGPNGFDRQTRRS
jgi:hypothetical protein